MIAEFVIHSAPVGKARPRVTSHGTYTPKKTKDYEQRVRNEYGLQCRELYFGGNPLAVYITAYYPIPKSASKSKREKMKNGLIRPTVKPDADNVAKAVYDALNGVAYYDDSQIVCLHVEKWYDLEPKVIVTIQDVV